MGRIEIDEGASSMALAQGAGPAPQATVAPTQADLPGVRPGFATVNRGRLHYAEMGGGAAVIFLHVFADS